MTFAVNKWSKRVLGSSWLHSGQTILWALWAHRTYALQSPKEGFWQQSGPCLFCNAVPSDTLLELYTVVTACALV